ncbi:MAG TPA: GNAT family N-acetyltransferase [Chitinophagaceae bacterium]|jgi:N-acetylglutamate synthase-like GNAT family acetyltransferase|nr:GNAT family N-acetyltransferase [Chitinophagaceae bacterium]
MQEQFFISTAQKDDCTQIAALVNSAYRGEYSKKGWTTEADLIAGSLRIDETSLLEMMERPDAVILKCADNDKNICGCVFLQKSGDQLYLGMLAVSPLVQGRGTGKQLLKAAEEHAGRTHCRSIIMNVISLRHELLAWYKRRGYIPTGETKPFPRDERFGTPRRPLEFSVLKKDVYPSENNIS